MNINGNTRNYNIDLLKILMCIGVVGIHTINASLSSFHYVISLLMIVCMPLFFMINGYLLLKKDKITYKYAFQKIIKILFVVFGWEMLHAAAYFMYYREFRNFLLSGALDFFQKGLFYHFWFFGALILLYLVLPVLKNIVKQSNKAYPSVIVILGFLCITLDFLQILFKTRFILEVNQTLRIWQWLFYFLLGGYFSNHVNNSYKNRITSKTLIWLTIILFVLVGYQYCVGNYLGSIYMNEATHGSLVVIVASTYIFWIIINMNLSNYVIFVTEFLSKSIMGVYIMHPFVLAVINKFVPLCRINGLMNIAFWLVTYFVCVMLTNIALKVPFINKLLKL